MSSFSGFRVVPGGILLILQKCPGFVPLSIDTQFLGGRCVRYISYSMFLLQNLFSHSLLVDPNACSHSPVPVIHFELCAAEWNMCCAQFSSCVVPIAFLQRTKKQVFLSPKWSRRLGSRMLGI
jgi:hypothetical protein